jgi:glycosyltransferase involved in cell wall biosynthesis
VHIGLLAPPWIPIPPPAYGGIEQVVALQARGFAEAGHDVTLIAAPGSRVPGVRVVSPLLGVPHQIGVSHDEWMHVLPGLEELADADVVIDHSGPLGAMISAQAHSSALHVVHGPLSDRDTLVYEAIATQAPRLRLVAISEAQRRMAPGLPFAAVCHNGIDLEEMPFSAARGGYLAFLGRMCPEKGPADAIAIARRSGMRLLIAAKCREPDERAYFEAEVAPLLGPDVEWLGELGPEEKLALLAGARALVFPITWPEPFGMVMIEAMACGTPVLATSRGSVPEVVCDGVTGFVRDDWEELAVVAGRIDEIDRARCRHWVAERFSAAAMTRSYELAIARVLDPGLAPLAMAGERQ